MFKDMSPRTQQILIIVTSAMIMIIVYTIYILVRGSSPDDKGTFYDKGSGETVVNNNATPEKFGTVEDSPTYLGTAKLLEIGLSKYQVEGIKSAYYKFSRQSDPTIKEVSIDVKSIKITAENQDGSGTLEFKTTLNRKDKYLARVDYSDISVIRLYLIKGSKSIYDSGIIDTTGLTNTNQSSNE